MANTLSKVKMRGSNTIYANKDACRQCPNRCTGSKNHKTVSFGPNTKVVLRIKEDKEKLKQRMCLSEHPIGTVKWYDGAHYLLCKGKEKAAVELGLSFLAYNLKRTINIVGTQGLIAAIRS